MVDTDLFDITMKWHQTLGTSPGPLGWLHRRGLTNDTIKAHRLGFVQTDATGSLAKFQGCISIPYFNGPRDQVTGMAFRRPEGQQPKYDRLKGPASLFNLTATEEPRVYITEGEFDAMVLGQLGLAAVGVPGATNFRPSWKYLFRDCESAVLVFDGDEAGQKGAMRVANALRSIVPVEVVTLPIGRDVTDMYLTDPDGLRKLLL